MSADPDVATAASFKVIEYAMKLSAQHKDNPKDDIIGALLRGTQREEGLVRRSSSGFPDADRGRQRIDPRQ